MPTACIRYVEEGHPSLRTTELYTADVCELKTITMVKQMCSHIGRRYRETATDHSCGTVKTPRATKKDERRE